MLEQPDLPAETIIACLRAEYGLRIQELAFLPITGDLATAVYRAVAEDGAAYFCKLRFNNFSEISVELPRFYSDQGIAQIIAPLATHSGRLWVEGVGTARLILYPFVEGQNGYAVELTEPQWRAFSTALWRIHTTPLPPALAGKVRRETFAPYWRDLCTGLLERLRRETFADPIAAALADFISPRRAAILDLIRRSAGLARALAARSTEMVLCHSDIHPGNLYIDTVGSLFIVDWDYPTIAPRERDLMFIGGGHGFVGSTAPEEEALFYRHYDRAAVNPAAMAYYRCEQNIIELSVQIPRILSKEMGSETSPEGGEPAPVSEKDREQSLAIIQWLFLPGGAFEMATLAAERMQDSI